jgi:hypothetical protein
LGERKIISIKDWSQYELTDKLRLFMAADIAVVGRRGHNNSQMDFCQGASFPDFQAKEIRIDVEDKEKV